MSVTTALRAQVPTDLTRAKAVELLQAMESLPQPVMVQCASGNRAGAVVGKYKSIASVADRGPAIAEQQP